MTNSCSRRPIAETQDWVAACGGQCKYDFVPFHFYGTNPNELIAYAKDFHTRYGKPLWVTEVCPFLWQQIVPTRANSRRLALMASGRVSIMEMVMFAPTPKFELL